jgi:hypothetical protein
LAQISEQLKRDEHEAFHTGLFGLGQLLGFEAYRTAAPGGPDGIWLEGSRLWLVFEAKTEERSDTPISAEAVRQAETHLT